MATTQPGIFAQGTRSHYHLELERKDGVTAADVGATVAALREPQVTAGGSNLVIGFGAALWHELAGPGDEPEGLQPFTSIGAAPATQHDLWVWAHGTGEDVVLDTARAVVAALAPVATLAAEQPCFVYKDSRDLTGFVDGTENPPIHEASGVATLPDGGPGAGGAFVLTQRWVHDLGRFHELALEEQEAVFGRTKPDSVELDDAVKPPTAHIARVVIEDDEGEELELYRRSAPYGTVSELGIYFVAFSAAPERFTLMLERMFGQSGDGLHDRLTDFSKPVSGSFWFAPSLEALVAMAGA